MPDWASWLEGGFCSLSRQEGFVRERYLIVNLAKASRSATAGLISNPKARLFDQVREVMRFQSAERQCTRRLRACLKNVWRGPLARPGRRPACAAVAATARRRPADRNGSGCPDQQAACISWGCPSRSVRRVAGRHRPVARATQPISKHALRRRPEDSSAAVAAVCDRRPCAENSSKPFTRFATGLGNGTIPVV